MKNKVILLLSLLAATFFLTSCDGNSAETVDNANETAYYVKDDVIISTDIPFTGITINEKSPMRGDIASNSKYMLTNLSPICTDTSSLAVYYANYGGDNYIYSYSDGKSELLIEMPGNFLNYWNGDLYFISNGKNLPELNAYFYFGNLYKYNIKNKTTELVLDMKINYLTVNEKGIFFEGNEDNVTQNYFLSFDGEKPVKLGLFVPLFYGEYQVSSVFDDETYKGLGLVSKDAGHLFLPDDDGFQTELNKTIVGDFFYYYDNSDAKVHSLNFKTGQTESYSASSEYYITNDEDGEIHNFAEVTSIDGEEQPKFADYSVMDNQLYVIRYDNYIYKYNTDEKMFIPVYKAEKLKYFLRLYNDGINLYAIVEQRNEDMIKNISLNILTENDEGELVLKKLG